MYKILIVEDERILREGTAEELADMGLFQIDTAANGEEALEMITGGEYDGIILDIRMPKMDGMQLLQRLHEQHNSSIKIIMSGYADFNYAKKGMEYGVSDFIVKPVHPDKIREVGSKLFSAIERKREESEQVEMLRTKLRDYLPMQADMIFVGMINGEYSGSEAEKKLSGECGISFAEGSVQTVLLYSPDKIERPSVEGARVFMISSDTAAVIFDSDSKATEEFVGRYNPIDSDKIICAVGEEKNGAERLIEACESAREALSCARMIEKSGVVRFTDVKRLGGNILLDELKFRMLLCLGNPAELKKWVNGIIESFPESSSVRDYYSFAIYIAMLCQNNVRRISADKFNPEVDFKEVFRIKTLKEFKLWTNTLIENSCKLINEKNSKRSTIEVEKTKVYIENHLSENISMSDLAKNAYISSNYLGKLFYDTLGISVSEYINTRRIERACELIREGNSKNYEIAEMVGFRDPNYFSALFKKIVGITPKEYKSLVSSREFAKKI